MSSSSRPKHDSKLEFGMDFNANRLLLGRSLHVESEGRDAPDSLELTFKNGTRIYFPAGTYSRTIHVLFLYFRRVMLRRGLELKQDGKFLLPGDLRPQISAYFAERWVIGSAYPFIAVLMLFGLDEGLSFRLRPHK